MDMKSHKQYIIPKIKSMPIGNEEDILASTSGDDKPTYGTDNPVQHPTNTIQLSKEQPYDMIWEEEE